jgi:hypothetical protein
MQPCERECVSGEHGRAGEQRHEQASRPAEEQRDEQSRLFKTIGWNQPKVSRLRRNESTEYWRKMAPLQFAERQAIGMLPAV